MRWQQQAWCDAGRLPILSGRTGGMETVRNPASARFNVEHRAVSAFRLSAPECQGTGSRTAQFLELLPMGNSQMPRDERRRTGEQFHSHRAILHSDRPSVLLAPSDRSTSGEGGTPHSMHEFE